MEDRRAAFPTHDEPLHRHNTPSRLIVSVIASLAPERAAALTASMVPLTMPNTTEITIIAVKIQAIAIENHLKKT